VNAFQLYPGEIIVDSFAGGGGASTGIEMALGRSPEVAINHDEEAIAMHAVNHPSARHYVSDVWEVDPIEACGGRRVGLAWFSPDCKHFSKAKGGKPVDKGVRGLAWVVVRWAKTVKPRIIILENVEEFQTWGPLLDDGTPCRERKGLTFRRWVAQLKTAGYQVEWKELRACDFGAPTTRKRLFVIARCDGQPIVWPEPTHGPGTQLAHHTAAECIDFTIPCPSIFLTRTQGRKLGIRRPLAANTMRRIARGVQRYVIDAKKPFIVSTVNGPAAQSLIQTSYGERKGQAPRVLDLDKPLGTVVAGGVKHSVVSSVMVPAAKIAAFIAKHNGGNEATGQELDAALDTVTCRDSKSLVATTLIKLRGTSTAANANEPAPTITAGGNHLAEVRAFLVKYYGADQDPRLEDPLHTITTKPRFALVMVRGEAYAIVDIGMRMLTPRELYRAQGFPDSYVIDFTYHGEPLSKEAQVRMVGNSVSPPLAAALVRANVGAVERLAEVA
jgi:DNA (cytosine-5)-methyltransferase 1